jgi:hypothetical protein
VATVGDVLPRQQVTHKAKTPLQTFAHDNGHRALQSENRGWLNGRCVKTAFSG